jgi:hypothetical protein
MGNSASTPIKPQKPLNRYSEAELREQLAIKETPQLWYALAERAYYYNLSEAKRYKEKAFENKGYCGDRLHL